MSCLSYDHNIIIYSDNYNPPLADAMEIVNNAQDICPELKNENMIEVAIANNLTQNLHS